MGNPRNESGKKGELSIKNFLNENKFPYIHSGNNGIDFQIFTKENTLYVDSKNQNSEGSVDEKLVQMARKYWRKYNYKEVYIVCGTHEIDKEVLISLEEDEVSYGYKTHIMSYQKFFDMMLGKTPEPVNESLGSLQTDLEQFFK